MSTPKNAVILLAILGASVNVPYGGPILNGLIFDRHEEEQNVQTFISAVRASIDEFLADPLGPPLVPNWARVWAGMPEAGPRLLAAVQESAVVGVGGPA